MGFFDSIKKGWSFMKAALAMAGQQKKLLLPALYLVLSTILYYVVWIAVLVAIDPQWSDGQWAIVGSICTFGSFLIFYFFCGVTVNMIDVHIKGGMPSLKEGCKDAGKNFLAITFLAIISTIVEMFAKAARSGDSIAAKIIAGIVEAIWTMTAFLLLPAIIIEDASFFQAMRRVRQIHKGNLLLIGIGEVGVRFFTGLLGFLVFVAIFGVIYVAANVMSGVAALVFALLVGGTLLALYFAFSIYLRMAYYTCLYVWAAAVEKAGASVPAPGPLGVALGHVQAPQAAAAAMG
jgi:hypothetical protein